MAAIEYAYPSDRIGVSVTPVLSGATEISGYGIANVADSDPSNPFKCDATTCRIVWDFGSPVTVKAVILVHHNLAAALAGVKFQMHTADSWATPDFSSTLTVPAYHEDNFPANILVDCRPTNPSKRYASLVVSIDNVVNVQFGEILILTEVRALSRNLILSPSGGGSLLPEDEETHAIIENVTDGGTVTVYGHGIRQRWIRGTVIEDKTSTELVRSLSRATQGRTLPFALLPKLKSGEPYFVRFEKSPLKRSYLQAPNFTSAYPLAFEEVGRGLVPQPSAV